MLRAACGRAWAHPLPPRSRWATTHPRCLSAAAQAGATGPSPARLIFSCERSAFFRLMTAGALSQAIFWSLAASIAYDMRDLSQEPEHDGSAGTDHRHVEHHRIAQYPLASKTTRIGTAALSLTMAALFLGLGATIPRRYTKQLELLGKRDLRITTYSLFGERQLTVPASQVLLNVNHPSLVQNKLCLFRIRGDTLFYFLDGSNGHVHSHKLFNHVFFRSSQ